MGTFFPKVPVKVYHPCKYFNLSYYFWSGHVYDELHFGGLWGDARAANYVAEIVDLIFCEARFVDNKLHPCFT